MITGIGIDIVEIDRIEKIIQRKKGFVERILVHKEKLYYEQLSSRRKVEFLAGRFAAKEAYAKAAGTGIGQHLSFQDIQVDYDEYGKPFILSSSSDVKVHLSISHSQQYAVAQVIIESLSS
ncbi:holo-ACP synthase [Bacillus songklensis]|uniref:Holo-[acyl-carrier-protein] synthase n=1 Tax=Bacillus songklensis TaxID=1069116 RepID=A0ABV8AXT0_9BACI